MPKTVIKFSHVNKTYRLYKNSKQRLRGIFFKNVKCKVKKAVDDLTFEINEGESVAIFGRNGGKINNFKNDYRGIIPHKR